MARPIADQVVVITGASSGIGRETARRFASQGARVVLTARNEEALRAVEEEIRREGGQALAVPADVADWVQVQQVAERAADVFGRIDTWVNNAAVTVYGTFEQIPVEEFRRVVDVVLMGHVHGAKAALPYLKQAKGTLVGIGSAVSLVPVPLQSPYTAAKWALKGLYDSLRLEQERQCTGARVSFVMPSSVDTPLFRNAKSHLGVEPGPIPPIYEPATVADAILYAATHPVGDMALGPAAVMAGLERMRLGVAEAAMRRLAFTEQMTDEPERPTAPNNLWRPVPGKGMVHGGFEAFSFDPFTWLHLHPAAQGALTAAALAALALPVALAALSWSQRRR